MEKKILWIGLCLPFVLCVSACGPKNVMQAQSLPRNSSILSSYNEADQNNEVSLDCGSPSRYDYLRMLSTGRASGDADLAAYKDDYRFLAVDGYGRFIPGTDAYVASGEKIYGYRVINGASDMICDAEHAYLTANAQRYAEIYNYEIIRLLKLLKSK